MSDHQNKAKHTSTPWEIYDTTKTHKRGRVFITGEAVMLAELPKWGDGKDLANAAFMVLAVNSHAGLVAGLISAKNELIDLGIDAEYLDGMNKLIAESGGKL